MSIKCEHCGSEIEKVVILRGKNYVKVMAANATPDSSSLWACGWADCAYPGEEKKRLQFSKAVEWCEKNGLQWESR